MVPTVYIFNWFVSLTALRNGYRKVKIKVCISSCFTKLELFKTRLIGRLVNDLYIIPTSIFIYIYLHASIRRECSIGEYFLARVFSRYAVSMYCMGLTDS